MGDVEAVVKASVSLRWPHVIAILGFLGLGGGYLRYTVVKADDRAGEARALAGQGAEIAKGAAAGAAQDYAAIDAKLGPTAAVAAATASACVTRAELEAVHRRIDALPLAGFRHRPRRTAPAVSVPSAVTAPLPPSAAPVAP